MHDADEVELKRMLGGIPALPAVVVAAYEKRRAFRNASTIGAGMMGVDALVQILIESGQSPVSHREIAVTGDVWRGFRDGDAVELKVDGKWIPGTFVRLAPLSQINVRRQGDDRVYCMKSFEVRPVVKVETVVTAETAEMVQVFFEGEWIDAAVKRYRADDTIEAMLPNDTKSFRVFKPEHVRSLELASK